MAVVAGGYGCVGCCTSLLTSGAVDAEWFNLDTDGVVVRYYFLT